MEATVAGWQQKALAFVMANIPSSHTALEHSALLLPFPGSTSSVETSSFSLLCSPDRSWRRRAPLPRCSVESTKLSFSPAKLAFFQGQTHQPRENVLPAPQVLSHAKQELTNCIFVL